MYSGGVVVHCPGSLSSAAAVLGAELLCSNGVLAKYTLERAQTVHHLDCVMSHTSSVVSHCVRIPKLKFPLSGADESNGNVGCTSD
jgi:hypothetical protein